MAIEAKPKDPAAEKDTPKYKVGDVLEVAQPAPEYQDVGIGWAGIVYGVVYDADKKMNRVYANWANYKDPAGHSKRGYVFEKNLKPYVGGTDISALLLALGMMLLVQGEHRMPSASKETIKKLGSAWDGSLQGLLEMLAWMESSEKVQQIIKSMRLGFIPNAFEVIYDSLKRVSELKESEK